MPNVMEIWEPKPPVTLWATLGQLQDCFTFYNFMNIYVDSSYYFIMASTLQVAFGHSSVYVNTCIAVN